MDIWLGKTGVWPATVMICLLVQAILTVIHRPWLDEWQALQIALQSPDWRTLFENLRYEGHPPLWYALLRIFSIFVPSLSILATLQIIVALTTQLTLFSWTAYSRAERLLIASSYFVLIEYGTVSRSLSLGALLTIAFFTLKSANARSFILCLLPLVDFQFGLISIIGLAIMWRDGHWSWVGAIIWLGSSLFAAWSVRPAPDMIPALDTGTPIAALQTAVNNLSVMMVPFHRWGEHWYWESAIPYPAGFLVGALFLLFVLKQLERDRFSRGLLATYITANLAFTMIVYPLALRHLTLIPLLFLMLKGRLAEQDVDNRRSGAFGAWLLLISIMGMIGATTAFQLPFNTAYQAANFIQSKNLQSKHWVSWPDSRGQGIAALLDIDIHTLGKGCSQSFIRWNFRDNIDTPEKLNAALKAVSNQYGRFYLISDHDLDRLFSADFVRPLAHFPSGYDGQAHYLFVVDPDMQESTKRPPRCPPIRNRLSDAGKYQGRQSPPPS